jgi:Family of unknown function (DUF6477)
MRNAGLIRRKMRAGLKESAMTDCNLRLATLRRPRLLMQAARSGLGDYRRERDLRRLLKGTQSPSQTVPSLIEVEEDLEATRLAGEATYSFAHHIEVLIALMAEAQLLRRGIA